MTSPRRPSEAHRRKESRRRGPAPLRPAPAEHDADPSERSPAHARFLALDRARAEREWRRYEGTPQRELFRSLRERFLHRHVRPGRWAVDLGAGPGRFTTSLGASGTRRVALDLSSSMLAVGRELAGDPGAEASIERVRGDALRPPLRAGGFEEVALLGNALGFETHRGPSLLDRAEELVAPGGLLLLEVAPGPGETSRYLSRLPAGAVRRLLAAPLRAIVPRVEREGYAAEPVRHDDAAFRRWSVPELERRWAASGWKLVDVLAVAPALGPDAARVAAVAADPRAWVRLLELEEAVGRSRARWSRAAAVLLAAERPRSAQTI